MGTNKKIIVTVVELLQRQVAAMLDDDMAAKVTSYLEKQGMTLRLGVGVAKIIGESGSVTGIELDSGEVVTADMLLVSVGARANLDLARQAGLALGTSGIWINEYMATSDPDIPAAGDN